MFDTTKLLIVIVFTIIPFSWLFFYKEKVARIFFLFFGCMYLIYSGIGGALESVSNSYLYYYCIFTICINLGVYIGLKYVKNNKKTVSILWYEYFNYYIKKYSTKIIVVYFLLILFPLVYPELKISNLISPPNVDALSMLQKFQRQGPDDLTSIISDLSTLVFPFYLLSLFKYGKKTLTLTVLVVLPYYIEYCSTAYLGRGSMLEAVIIILAVTYFIRPKLGKKLIVAGMIAFPFMIIFFVQYSIIRIGGTASNIDFGDALEILFSQECGYQEDFDRILNMDGNYIFRYLLWLCTIPLPGIFRGGIDVHFAAIYSEQILGIARSSSGFYILLPGVVGESVFLLGNYLFGLNGIIYGLLMGISYRLLTRYPQLIVILVYALINFGYVINRAGLFGGIPFILKVLVYFFLILYFMKSKTNWRLNGSH